MMSALRYPKSRLLGYQNEMHIGVVKKCLLQTILYEWHLEDGVSPRLDWRGAQEAQRADGRPRVRDPREADVLLEGRGMCI